MFSSRPHSELFDGTANHTQSTELQLCGNSNNGRA
jgi:hypothetical protein